MKITTYPHSRRARLAAEAANRAFLIESLEPRRHLHAGHDGIFVNAGGGAFLDAGGHAWQTDAHFSGGEVRPDVYDVARTPDDPVYASRRFGRAFDYAIPIPAAGTYRVTLLFAEPWFTAAGRRVFDVSAEGTRRVAGLDLFATGGLKGAVSRTFDVPVTDGTLNLQFRGVVENAIVGGIAVERAAQIPAAPSGLAATAISTTRIDLRWVDNSSEETGFAIERSVDGGSTFAQVAVVGGNVTSYSNTGLSPGTTYVYRIRATSAAGMSSPSPASSARTPASTAGPADAAPYGGVPAKIPGTVPAENFDTGGSGVGYFDQTPENAGGQYRQTPVDIYPIPAHAVMPTGFSTAASAAPGLLAVGSIRAGEWLSYTVEATRTASYAVSLCFASGSQGGRATLTLDGQSVWGSSITLPNTGGWSRFTLINLPARQIPAGRHVIRLTFVSATRTGEEIGVLDGIRFSATQVGAPSNDPPPPVGGEPVAAPTGLVARAAGDTQVNLAWTDVASNETGYRVERRVTGATAWTRLADLPANTNWYADSTAVAATPYVYRVTALGPGGTIAAGSSTERSVTTLPAAEFAWSGTNANPLPRYEASGVSANGRVYVFGGYINSAIQATARVDAFDPARNTWRRLRDMPEVVTHAGHVADGPYVYLLGGFIGDHPGLGSTSVWRYDTRDDTYTRMPGLPAPRGAGAAAIVARELHFFGGLVRSQFVTVNQAEHWVLDLTNPALGWKNRAPLPNARNHLSAVELGGKIYAIGGQDLWNEATGQRANVDVFDYRTNTWSPAAPLPSPRSHVSSSTFALDGRIYVIGGVTNNYQTLRDVAIYNLATNTWSAGPRLLAPRMSPVAAAVGKQIVVTTGMAYGLLAQGETFVGLLD